jgi:hypothetical protein
MYSVLADLTLVVHFTFVLFVILGGFLVLRWQRLAWVHVPVALYGAAIEFFGWVCPLTPLENDLRQRAGEAGYEAGFVEHYLLPILYPGEMTQTVQIVLGLLVIAINAVAYGLVLRQRRRRRAGTLR